MPRTTLVVLVTSASLLTACASQLETSASPPGDEATHHSTSLPPGAYVGSPSAVSYDASSPSPTVMPPAALTVVTLTLRNSCSKKVSLFFGDEPKLGRGTYSSMSANSSTSKRMRPGEMIWVVDESQNGISSVTIAIGMSTVEITSGCRGFTSH